MVQLSASRSASHTHGPVQCGTPVCSEENGGAGAAHFGVAVGGFRLRKSRSEMALGAASRRSMQKVFYPKNFLQTEFHKAVAATVSARHEGKIRDP